MSPSTRQKNSSKQQASSSGLSDRQIRHARRVSSSSLRDAANLSSRRQTSARPQLPTNTTSGSRTRTTPQQPPPRPTTCSSSPPKNNTDEDKIEHIARNTYTAYINGHQYFSFQIWDTTDKKRVVTLQKLIKFKNENGFTTVPSTHDETELYHYMKNVRSAFRSEYEGVKMKYKFRDFEKKCLTMLGVADKDRLWVSEADRNKSKKFRALREAGREYRKKFNHFSIFSENEENNLFRSDFFSFADNDGEAIQKLRDIFIEFRNYKKIGKDRINALKESLGVHIKDVDLASLGFSEAAAEQVAVAEEPRNI